MTTPNSPLRLCLIGALLPACNPDDGRPQDSSSASGSSGITSLGTDTNATGSSGTGSGTTSSGSSSTGGSTGSSGSSGGMECGEAMVMPMAIPPNVMLVLDKSGSMVANSWDHDGDAMTPTITRWNSLHNVVTFILNGFDAQINFGATLFPSLAAQAVYGANACPVEAMPEVAVAAMGGMDILAAIPAATGEESMINGATPATAGINTALAHLQTLDPTIQRFIIFITDGAANCSADSMTAAEYMENYDTHLPEAVAAALAAGVPTFVVGIDIKDMETGVGNDGSPQANTYQKLNEVADAGGKARPGAEKFYNAANETELQAALQDIAGAVISCTIPLDPPPDMMQMNYVEITINNMVYTPVTDCATEDGFIYSNLPALDEITLCGAACDEFKAAMGILEAKYGCPPAG